MISNRSQVIHSRGITGSTRQRQLFFLCNNNPVDSSHGAFVCELICCLKIASFTSILKYVLSQRYIIPEQNVIPEVLWLLL